MKAAVLTAYGPPEVLQIQEVDRPIPGPNDLLIRVHASTVTAGDGEIRSSKMPWLFKIPIRLWLGVFKPRPTTILGMELSGTVEAAGADVQAFRPGDTVFAMADMGFGGCAEYAVVPADGLVAKKPASVSFEQASAVPIGGLAALGYLRKGGVEQARTVLVRGASGSIGTWAVQLAKHFGCHVTGVCGPEGRTQVTRLGADVVLDYTTRDFTDDDRTYDLFLDVVGRMPISTCLRAVNDRGTYVRATIPGAWELLRALWTRLTSSKRVIMGDAGGSAEDLAMLARLLERRSVETVVDRRFPLDQIAQAHHYVDGGHKQGNVIITVREGSEPVV